MADHADVPIDVSKLAERLAHPLPMRRGSVTERWVKCGKAGCACVDNPKARHGPYFSVSRVVKGKTRSIWLSGAQAETVRAQIAAGQEFRALLDEYWTASERWADTELAPPDAASKEAAKKGGSKSSSSRKSSRK
jgi:hypothetical protein